MSFGIFNIVRLLFGVAFDDACEDGTVATRNVKLTVATFNTLLFKMNAWIRGYLGQHLTGVSMWTH